MAALRRALRTEQNVRFALLFGSAARGTDTPTSDVDVMVVLRDPALDRVIDLSAQLTAAIGRPVEVVRLGDAEDDTSFLAEVVSEGRVLVDRDHRWPYLRSREPALRRRGSHDMGRRAAAALASIDQLLAG
jgi:predicted nucleotidyltransferase